MHLTFNALFLKSLIFLIRGDVDKKIQKKQEKSNLQKKESWGINFEAQAIFLPINTGLHNTQKEEGGNFTHWEKQETLTLNLNLSLPKRQRSPLGKTKEQLPPPAGFWFFSSSLAAPLLVIFIFPAQAFLSPSQHKPPLTPLTQKQIRTGRKRPAPQPADLPHFLPLLLQTYNPRTDLPPFPPDLFLHFLLPSVPPTPSATAASTRQPTDPCHFLQPPIAAAKATT